jgi:hypothetical protein
MSTFGGSAYDRFFLFLAVGSTSSVLFFSIARLYSCFAISSVLRPLCVEFCENLFTTFLLLRKQNRLPSRRRVREYLPKAASVVLGSSAIFSLGSRGGVHELVIQPRVQAALVFWIRTFKAKSGLAMLIIPDHGTDCPRKAVHSRQ